MQQYEFETGGISYRGDKMDAFKQLHVSRKIAPVIPKLIPVFVKLQAGITDDMSLLADAAGPFAEALAAMPEADVDYVCKTCLASVKRNASGAWSSLVVDGTLMFSDMDLGQMLPVVMRVLRENLGNFMQGLLAGQGVAAIPAPAP